MCQNCMKSQKKKSKENKYTSLETSKYVFHTAMNHKSHQSINLLTMLHYLNTFSEKKKSSVESPDVLLVSIIALLILH